MAATMGGQRVASLGDSANAGQCATEKLAPIPAAMQEINELLNVMESRLEEMTRSLQPLLEHVDTVPEPENVVNDACTMSGELYNYARRLQSVCEGFNKLRNRIQL